MDSAERDLAVEIESNNELFASPVTPRHKVTDPRKDSTGQFAKGAGYVTSPLRFSDKLTSQPQGGARMQPTASAVGKKR